MSGLMTMLSEKISKALWLIRDPGLPIRRIPARINFCIHTEVLYDAKIYDALLIFSKDFLSLTGKRLVVCVSTPVCPLVKAELDRTGKTPESIGDRIRELSKFAEIGYHGHFYIKGFGGNTQISDSNYDKGTVIAQIRDEIAWLNGIGVSPKVYIGGWWFLTADIVVELERAGICVDVSVRKGRRNTFGGSYIDDAAIPDCGRPFILPPSKNIIEMQSMFGPVMITPIMNGHLSRYIDKYKEEPIFLIFPIHDWDVPEYIRNLRANVDALHSAAESVAWTDIMDMRREAASNIAKGGPSDQR